MKIPLIILLSILFIACVESKMMINYKWNVGNFVPVNCSEKISWDEDIKAISFDADDKLCTNRNEFILEKPLPDDFIESRVNLTMWNKSKTNFICYLGKEKYYLTCQISGEDDLLLFPLEIRDYSTSEAHCSEPDNILSCTIKLDIVLQQPGLQSFTFAAVLFMTICGIIVIIAATTLNNYKKCGRVCHGIIYMIIIGLMILCNSALIFDIFYKWGMPTNWESYRTSLLLILFIGCPLINLFWILVAFVPFLLDKYYYRSGNEESNPVLPFTGETTYSPYSTADPPVKE